MENALKKHNRRTLLSRVELVKQKERRDTTFTMHNRMFVWLSEIKTQPDKK